MSFPSTESAGLPSGYISDWEKRIFAKLKLQKVSEREILRAYESRNVIAIVDRPLSTAVTYLAPRCSPRKRLSVLSELCSSTSSRGAERSLKFNKFQFLFPPPRRRVTPFSRKNSSVGVRSCNKARHEISLNRAML